MSEAMIPRMVHALDLEIRAIKKQGGSTSIELRGGERRGTAEGNVLYAFPVAEDIYLRDESPVRLTVGQQEIDGTVVSLREGVLLIALDHDCGPTIPFARLRSDDSFLLERLKQRLEEALAGETTFHHDKAEQAAGARPVRSADADIDPSLTLGGEPLNREQLAAIRRALGSEVTYLWGPPGTGKTTVVARIVEGCYRTDRSVLVVSNTNVAVDTALEKIADRLQSDVGFQQGTVLRHGPIVKPELEQKHGDHVVMDRVVARLSQDLQAELEALQSQRVNVEAAAAQLRRAIAELDELEEAKAQLQHARASLQQAEAKQQATQLAISSIAERIRSLEHDLQRWHEMGSIRRFFSGLDPDRIRNDIATASAEGAAHKHALPAIEREVEEARGRLEHAKHQTAMLSELLRGHPPREECQKQLAGYEQQMGDLMRRLQQVQSQMDAVRAEVIKNCKVLATTVYRTYLKGQVERTFDAVVIDEASMLTLPLVFYAAGLAARQVVVAGDFRQLPPIVVSDEPEATGWLKQDLFHKAGIAAAVRRGETPAPLVALRLQYRMHEVICSVVNDLFYRDHPLETASSVRRRSAAGVPLGDSPLLYVDTAALHPWASLRLGTYSRYNVLHALLLRNIICHLDQEGYLSPPGALNEALGIVSPYAAQTSLVRRLVAERLSGRSAQFTATVHQFQGNEKDTILIDLTDSLGARPSRFIRAASPEEDGGRLLNVALSRARHHLVLVANFGYLRAKLGQNCIAARILDLFEQHGQPLDMMDLLPLGPEDWLDALRPLEPPHLEFDSTTAGAFTEGTFYPAFAADLQQATECIVIFSPYLTARMVGHWINALRSKMSQGVRVRLVTRPPGNQGGVLEEGVEELIADIVKVGVAVDLRHSMHEKFAVIDNKILWHGSLNILSHHNTSESMLRIPSAAACHAVAGFVSAPTRRTPGEKEEQVDLAARENPECPECNWLTVLRSGRYGIYFECARCKAKVDPRRANRSARQRRASRVVREAGATPYSVDRRSPAKTCPECGRRMTQRAGRHGPFLGCTGYPQCRHTEPVS